MWEDAADQGGRPSSPLASWHIPLLGSHPSLPQHLPVRQAVDGPGTAYLFFYDKQDHWGLSQDTVHAIQAHMEEAFLEWISCSAHFTISLFPLMEVWWQAVAASNRQRLRSQAENPVLSIPVVNAGESNSSVQLVGSAPQQVGRPPQWKRWLKQGSPPIQGLHNHMDDHLSPSAWWWAEEAHLLPLQTEGHRTPMGTSL